MEDLIRKYVLQNALRYDGKADPGRIIGKVLGENPELRKQAKELNQKIRDIVDEVNGLSLDEQKAELEKLAPEMLDWSKEKREGLKELPSVDYDNPKVVMRFEPSPSGPLHIGHSYVAALNIEYAKMYKGKIILRISDTNPANTISEAYDRIPEDFEWLAGEKVETHIQSDRMDIYYDYALKLFESSHAYVCLCDPEEFREMMKDKVACPCRDLVPEAQLKRWHLMSNGYKEGEAVVRFKTDVNHKNPAMRDFPLLRINDDEHPRKGRKYRVWPLMNFSVAIDDLEMGVTHTLRAKDHADNAKRQEYIHNALNHSTPIAISVGMINFEGFEVSASKTRKKIEEGLYNGWDDSRIPFLPALRRRGYTPDALKRYAVDVGVTKNDKSVAMDEFFTSINTFNREVIDANAMRYSFVKDPVSIIVNQAPEMTAELDFHPDNKKGGRVFHTNGAFHIDPEDFERDGLVRLAGLFNIRKSEGTNYNFNSVELDRNKCDTIIHWVVDDNPVNVEVMMPDGTRVKGIGEKYLNDVKVGEMVQFERFGFARCDEITDQKMVFWFAHK